MYTVCLVYNLRRMLVFPIWALYKTNRQETKERSNPRYKSGAQTEVLLSREEERIRPKSML